jgi:hypothetical protein
VGVAGRSLGVQGTSLTQMLLILETDSHRFPMARRGGFFRRSRFSGTLFVEKETHVGNK